SRPLPSLCLRLGHSGDRRAFRRNCDCKNMGDGERAKDRFVQHAGGAKSPVTREDTGKIEKFGPDSASYWPANPLVPSTFRMNSLRAGTGNLSDNASQRAKDNRDLIGRSSSGQRFLCYARPPKHTLFRRLAFGTASSWEMQAGPVLPTQY